MEELEIPQNPYQTQQPDDGSDDDFSGDDAFLSETETDVGIGSPTPTEYPIRKESSLYLDDFPSWKVRELEARHMFAFSPTPSEYQQWLRQVGGGIPDFEAGIF